MADRTSQSGAKLWVLLDVDRYALAAVVLVGCFLTLVAVAFLAPTALERAIDRSDPVETVFQAFVGSIITGVTLVVTITQVVLSQEQGPLGDQRQRMEGAMSFRDDVEAVLDAPVSPPDPAGFLRTILEGAGDSARTLGDRADLVADADVRDRVERVADVVAEDATDASESLANVRFGGYDVVSAALEFNYAGKIYDARSLRTDHGEELPDDVAEPLDDLLRSLNFFAPAREHVKTLYFQWALIDLSRDILYAAVPGLLVSIAMILYADAPGTITGQVLGLPLAVWVVAAALTVALTPFVILTSYMLRIGTVAKRTLAMGPFVLRETDRSGENREP